MDHCGKKSSKINLSFDKDGNIAQINLPDCLEVLKRLYRRSMDPESSDFESLTLVQAMALRDVLSCHGCSLPKLGRSLEAENERS